MPGRLRIRPGGMDGPLKDQDASREAYLEAALEEQARAADEAITHAVHTATLLGESDAKRFAQEKALASIHAQFVNQLHHEDAPPCVICALGVVT